MGHKVCDINELRTLPSGVKKPEFPVDIGEMHEGERVRKPQMHLEFGGLKAETKWELIRTRKEDEITDATGKQKHNGDWHGTHRNRYS